MITIPENTGNYTFNRVGKILFLICKMHNRLIPNVSVEFSDVYIITNFFFTFPSYYECNGLSGKR